MISDPASPRTAAIDDAAPYAGLDENSAMWLRRGQRLGEMLLTSRKHAAYAWSATLTLAGASLIMLALIGTPADHNRRQSIYEQSVVSQGTEQASSSDVTQSERN